MPIVFPKAPYKISPEFFKGGWHFRVVFYQVNYRGVIIHRRVKQRRHGNEEYRDNYEEYSIDLKNWYSLLEIQRQLKRMNL